MPVLVTGATGFLGGRLAQVLSARGEVVRILARRGRNLSHLEGTGVQVMWGGLADADVLTRGAAGVTHIYHCAGCSTDWAPLSIFYETNVSGVRNLLGAAAKNGKLRRLVHVSTTDVYGYPRVPCAETHPIRDAGLPYNSTKGLGEKLVWEAGRVGMPVTVVRPATIYGPRGTVFATEIAQHIQQGSMAVIGGGRAAGGFCYVDNVVNAMIDAAASPATKGEAYNVSDGTGVNWRVYVDALADGLGFRRPWIDIPAWAAFALARSMEAGWAALGVARRPLLTRHAVYLFAQSQEFPIDKARRDFGFCPAVSFEDGMRRTIEWLRTQL
jgi:nucleoside-diphosphate-sugar epimerase